jgi:hypothetical protein
MKKITYVFCLYHQRVFNPTLCRWEKAIHGFSDHFGVHLETQLCDLCEKERTHDEPKKHDQDHVAEEAA